MHKNNMQRNEISDKRESEKETEREGGRRLMDAVEEGDRQTKVLRILQQMRNFIYKYKFIVQGIPY